MSFKSRNFVKISISEEFSKFIAFLTSGSPYLKKILVLISSPIVEGTVGILLLNLDLILSALFFKKLLFGLYYKQN